MNKYRESKEEIKDRMIRTALDYWNIRNIENLDPFIRLLIEAMAAQLHLLSEEIADIEVRTMQRLSEVLLPESVSLARPSHAIVHIETLLEDIVTDPFEGFYVQSPFAGKKDNIRYSFYPVCKTPLRMGGVKKLIIGGEVYDALQGMHKKLLLRSDLTPENHNKVFVGLDFGDEVKNLSSLSFYIDFPNIARKNEFLHLLSYCRWSFNETQLKMEEGLFSADKYASNDLSSFFDSQKHETRIVEDVLSHYKKNYRTICGDVPVSSDLKSSLPLSLQRGKNVDKEYYTEVCKEDLFWIEIEFSPHFSPAVLSDIQIGINTIPVINKELHIVTTDIRKVFGVIPIPGDENESFLGIADVTDSNGNTYFPIGEYRKSGAEHSYSIRRGGCEAFDERDAVDYLQRLQELLEDEMGVFSPSHLGVNAENPYLINQLIQKLKQESHYIHSRKEKTHYLFVESSENQTLLTIRYWTTLGDLANGIRIGQPLNSIEADRENMQRTTMLTPSAGGRGIPSDRERTARFRHILSSRNRIVTNSDIRSFCLAELTDSISDVRIEKGIMLGKHSKEGLVRTIDVHLILLSPMDDHSKLQEMKANIYNQLVAHSPMTFNYRIFID
ncbi:hypothetical protein [Bacteroides heparinolyticus]|uniref:hypothetical protein n=1 Tax=Prevotella heparinolytica TaxID=28113 RepID=UPI0035A06DCC